jgi:CheY-like chemotaxis protein
MDKSSHIPPLNNFYLNTYVINSYNFSSNRSVNSVTKRKSSNEINNNNNNINNKLNLPNEPHMDSFNFEISSRRNSLSEQPKSKFTKKENSSGKFLIFIVDDHKLIRSTLKSLVNKVLKEKKLETEFEVLEGRDGVDIIFQMVNDQSNNNRIKCVITDENMEYINGSYAIQIIRKLEKERKIRNVPIASITAFEDETIRELISKAGADMILSKPCNNKSILKFLEDFGVFEKK